MSAKKVETKTTVKTVEEAQPTRAEKALELIPRATEKAYTEQTKRTYVFFVPMQFTKQEVMKQVKKQFQVTAEDVRILIRKGKAIRYNRGKHAYPGTTFRRDRKVAYVTLKEGDKIQIFEEQEQPKEEAKEDQKGAK